MVIFLVSSCIIGCKNTKRMANTISPTEKKSFGRLADQKILQDCLFLFIFAAKFKIESYDRSIIISSDDTTNITTDDNL